MKFLSLETSQLVARLSCLLFLLVFLGCRDQLDVSEPASPPTQRVAAKTTLYVTLDSWQRSYDTVQVAGVNYPINAMDSSSFRYDARQRVVGENITQIALYQTLEGDKRISNFRRNEYTYQESRLIERAAIGPQGEGRLFEYPLDSTGYRVLAHTQEGYSFVNFDSLRVYSPDGILISAVQISYNPTYPPKNTRTPNVKIIVESGNITRIESYYGSGKLYQIARFVYDNKHYAPLATDTYLGETSCNVLVRQTVITYEPNETLTYDYTYANEYDSQGRLMSQLEYALPTKSSPLGTKILTKFYY